MVKKIIYLYLSLLSFIIFGKTDLNIIYDGYPYFTKWFNEIKPEFEKQYPDIKLNFIITPSSSNVTYNSKLAIMLNDGKVPDVALMDIITLKSFVDAHYLAPIKLKSWDEWQDFNSNIKKSVSFNGKYYSIPITTDTRGLYYNKNIFQKAGINIPWKPKSWNDIIETCGKIKDKMPEVWPLFMYINANNEATTVQTALMLLYGTQDRLFANGKWNLKSKGLLDTFKFIETIYTENLGVPAEVLLENQRNNLFAQKYCSKNKVAVFMDACYINEAFDENGKDIGYEYLLAPMPTQFGKNRKYVTVQGELLLGISAKSEKKDAALKFIEFAAGKNSLFKLNKSLYTIPPRIDSINHKGYPDKLKEASKLFNYANYRPENEEYPIVSNELQSAIEQVALKKKTPEEALDEFAKNVKLDLNKNE